MSGVYKRRRFRPGRENEGGDPHALERSFLVGWGGSVAWVPKVRWMSGKTGVKLTCVCVCVSGYALFTMMNEVLITNAGKRIFFFFRFMLTIRLRD